jgi:cysteine-rich repeat protein
MLTVRTRIGLISASWVVLAACVPGASTESTSFGTFTTEPGDGDGDTAETGSGDGDGDGDGDPGDGDGDGESSCGDALVDMGEECDLGPENAETGLCTPECTIAECGDGYVYEGFEECDDGNADSTDDCVDGCAIAVCGDGYVHVGVEECDDGNDDETDGCAMTCTPGVCGDGILQGGEQCDDGNMDTFDACPACQLAFCGDSYIQAGVEICDDGNVESNDGCISPFCIPAECGDGELWDGMETCDDGNLDDTDECPGSCQPAFCGDGYYQAGVEGCDDGNNISDDGCTADCVAEYCFHFDNTDQVDLMNIDWFDDCVDMPGNNVMITVRDANNQVVYQGSGPKEGMWTYDQLTSTAAAGNQYEVYNHDRAIMLDNGDLLRISGKNSNNSGCGGSLGNGYVIMTYDAPLADTYYNRIKLLVAPYNHTVGGAGVRNFGAWTAGGELSWNDDMYMYSCFPLFGIGPSLTAFTGSMSFTVY